MNEPTIRTLNDLNRQFYQQQAQSWQASRQYAWPSWQTFVERSQLTSGQSIQVADIGCGTGRLAPFIGKHFPQAGYTGFDASPGLLELAREEHTSLPGEVQWQELDVVEQLLSSQPLLPKKYDLITVFGVLHHIPSQALRQRFLRSLAEALLPGGEIWLTVWLPEKLGQRLPQNVSIDEVAQHWPISADQLETGDVFLGWKNTAAVRYVHWLQPAEAQALKNTPGLMLEQSWQETSPGERGNECWLLRRMSTEMEKSK